MRNVQNLKVPRLGKNRHGVFYVRASALDPEGKRRVSQHSLSTKDPHLARVLALRFCLTLAEGVELKKTGGIADLLSLHTNPLKVTTATGEVVDFDPSNPAEVAYADKLLSQAREQANALYKSGATLQEAMAATAPTRPALSMPIAPTQGAMLKEALEQHLAEEAQHGHVSKTMGDKKKVYADFLAFFGDIPLNDITREEVGRNGGWRTLEFRRPNEKSKDPNAKRSGVTLDKRRNFLSKFFDWAHEAGKYHRPNPLSQKMATKAEMKAQRTPWAEFTDGDIKALFCPAYAQAMNKPDFYWLPLMALFSGARLGELARLELSTFEEVDGVKCYRIQDGKTLESRRTVPIHSRLLALGLWEYAQALKAKNATFLIPHRPHDPAGTKKENRTKDPEKMTGRQWGKWVGECGITDKAKVFHSFRSTAITDLRNTEANTAAIKRSVGHTTPDMGGAHGGYVRGIVLKTLQKAVEHLTHSQVDFEALKLADPTFSEFFALEDAKNKTPKALENAERKERNLKAKAEREERNRDKRKKQGAAP
jgi:integrase